MKIGIIGAGNIGGTLARKLSAGGHSVKLAGSKGPDAVREQAERVGAVPVAAPDAVTGVEVIVLSVPFGKIPELAGLFKNVPLSVPVIDTSNYYPQRDGHIPEVDGGKPESVWVSEKLGRPVVKAFNAVLAHTLAELGMPRGAAGRTALPIAGDDSSAKAIASDLVDLTGFDAVDSGNLANSWRQQPGTPAYCTELPAPVLREALAAADKERAPRDRDALMGEFMKALPSHEAVVTRNRAVTARR